jgi:hypothetical protein
MPSTSASRPRGSDELAVEAWGQGLMVGSLMVMIAVTLVNMRNGVLLHKLIVAEVGLPSRLVNPASVLTSLAYSSDFPWHVHFPARPGIRLVSFNHSHWPECLLVSSQSDRLAETPAVL